eukprot:PhF_6_TR38125/c0_g1_i1/m.56919/K06027/NSF, SEC18; vesicle-fusing ATPase
MSLFKVVPTPSDAQTLTNLVYVPPGTVPGNGKLIEVNGFVFTLGEDAQVPAKSVAFNARQRACTKVSTTVDSIPLIEFPPSSVKPLVLVKVDMEFSTKPPAGTPVYQIDAPTMTKTLLNMLTNQVVTIGQQIVTVYNDKKFICNVRSVEIHEKEGVKADKIVRGLIAPGTLFVFNRTDGVSYQNVPAELDQGGQTQLFPEGFNFEMTEIGGLGKQLEEIFRRAFEPRTYPRAIIKKLKIRFPKGVLLYGPPGTGKTLIAKRLAALLGCKNLTIVNGPEMFDKYVGQTEANIRKLFAAAEAEYKSKGDDSQLHIIVFDEFDSMVKHRGSNRDGTGVGDNAVNQLLAKIDGPEELNNVLLIGMTNRKDMIDEAVLRPGRFEVHVEITLPSEEGRLEIFQIKTKSMKDEGLMEPTTQLEHLAALTKNYSGADIEGVVNNAVSFAMHRHVDMKNPTKFKNPEALKICQQDFEAAIAAYKPALGVATDELTNMTRNGIIDYGMMWTSLFTSCMSYAETLRQSKRLSVISLLLEGPVGSGKSALAAHVAKMSNFPYVKVIRPDMYVGYTELAKCNAIRQAFEDADRSPLSVVIVDDVERLIEYVHVGQRFSNAVLQTLLVMVKRQPPKGKLLVIGTTSNRDLLNDLELGPTFFATRSVCNLDQKDAMCVIKQLDVKFASPEEESKTREALPREIPLKRLTLVVERALSFANEEGSVRPLTADDFQAAMD